MAEIRGIELTADHIGRRVVVATLMGGFFAGMIISIEDDGCAIGSLSHPDQVSTYPFDVISWWD